MIFTIFISNFINLNLTNKPLNLEDGIKIINVIQKEKIVLEMIIVKIT